MDHTITLKWEKQYVYFATLINHQIDYLLFQLDQNIKNKNIENDLELIRNQLQMLESISLSLIETTDSFRTNKNNNNKNRTSKIHQN